MKFDPKNNDSHSAYNSSEPRKYTVPIAGIYLIKSKIINYVPTGTFHMVPNKDRRWFQLWKPKFIREEIFVIKETLSGQEFRLYQKGQIIDLNTVMEKIK